MTAIEQCRTAALGGHLEQCDHCGHRRVWYNSCRNRHCPQCQGLARAAWVQARKADLLDCEYFHVVFTLPPAVAAIALHNKALVYGILFRTVAQTLQTIAADPPASGRPDRLCRRPAHVGADARPSPHLHCVVPGGGLSPDGARWMACRPGFFLPVRVLARLFRRLFLTALQEAFDAGRLQLTGELARLTERATWADHLRPARQADWVVYAKPPFAGPAQVLDYVGRYTHRIAIANQRILDIEAGQVRFRYTDYRAKGRARQKTMRLAATEFIRRVLVHVLPPGFHRIRYYGLLAHRRRQAHLATCRHLLSMPPPDLDDTAAATDYRDCYAVLTGRSLRDCPRCADGAMHVVDRLLATDTSPPILDSS